MPWKNGKGTTTEVAVFPEGAGLEDFGWRVSIADVREDGPFSTFPGIDRTLSVLDGEGIELAVSGQEEIRLDGSSEPFAFPADIHTGARLVAGPITDLNVMTRRSDFRHRVKRATLNEVGDLDFEAEITLLLCQKGSLDLLASGEKIELNPLDAVLVPRQTRVDIGGSLSAVFFAISIDPIA